MARSQRKSRAIPLIRVATPCDELGGVPWCPICVPSGTLGKRRQLLWCAPRATKNCGAQGQAPRPPEARLLGARGRQQPRIAERTAKRRGLPKRARRAREGGGTTSDATMQRSVESRPGLTARASQRIGGLAASPIERARIARVQGLSARAACWLASRLARSTQAGCGAERRGQPVVVGAWTSGGGDA